MSRHEREHILAGNYQMLDALYKRTEEAEWTAHKRYKFITEQQHEINELKQQAAELKRKVADTPLMTQALEEVMASYCLCIGSHQETPEMKRARTLVGIALDKLRGR